MSCYGPLAQWYDQLTGDVSYEDFADLYEQLFRRESGEFHTLLDLACGTGTLTSIMTRRGYEMIAVDSSEDMLLQAREKAAGLSPAPLYLMQDAEELDLYGTVDACYCSLDGMNYIPQDSVPEVFHRLQFFIRPGGLLIFDIRTPDFFRRLDGDIFVDENEDVLCLWRADFDEQLQAIIYGMDLFTKKGRLWSRDSEEHIEYVHEPSDLKEYLEKEGFYNIRIIEDCLESQPDRLFIVANRSLEYGQDHQSHSC